MSNYQRLISYIYTYEGGIRGKNIGFAKLETRGNQCRITVNVKKIFVGGNPVGVYLLAGQDEVRIGTLFARNGAGEFRTVVNSADVENSGHSLEEFYGLSVHDVESAWRSYTTIWEDAVAHAAEVELADVTSEKVAEKQENTVKTPAALQHEEKEQDLFPISREIEAEIEREAAAKEAEIHEAAVRKAEEYIAAKSGQEKTVYLSTEIPRKNQGEAPSGENGAAVSGLREMIMTQAQQRDMEPLEETFGAETAGMETADAGTLEAGETDAEMMETRAAESGPGAAMAAGNRTAGAGTTGTRTSNRVRGAGLLDAAGPLDAVAGPADAEARLAEAEARPVDAEARLAEAEARPANAEARPAGAEARPVDAGARPVEAKARPAGAEARPVDAGARPVEAETRPAGSGAAGPGPEVTGLAWTGKADEPVALETNAAETGMAQAEESEKRTAKINVPGAGTFAFGAAAQEPAVAAPGGTMADVMEAEYVSAVDGLENVQEIFEPQRPVMGGDARNLSKPQENERSAVRSPGVQMQGTGRMTARPSGTITQEPGRQMQSGQERVGRGQQRYGAQRRGMQTGALRRETLRPDSLKPETPAPEILNPKTPGPETLRPEASGAEALRPETPGAEALRPETSGAEALRPETPGPETLRPGTLRPESPRAETPGAETLRAETPRPESLRPGTPESAAVTNSAIREAQPVEREASPPSGVSAPFKDLSDTCSEQEVWETMRKKYPKILAFDYADGCEVLTIKPQDIGLLPREEWVYGSNSFLLHGYYNYRYLILARLNNPGGKARYLLGVPGHYLSNEKYMASMFGFSNFVLAKKQPPRDGRFGYWYTDVKIGD